MPEHPTDPYLTQSSVHAGRVGTKVLCSAAKLSAMLTGAIWRAAEPLRDFVGPVGMYGHMNDILVENMAMFKAFAEGAELADVQTARAEDRAAMAEDSKAFWEEFWVRRRTLAERLWDGTTGRDLLSRSTQQRASRNISVLDHFSAASAV